MFFVVPCFSVHCGSLLAVVDFTAQGAIVRVPLLQQLVVVVLERRQPLHNIVRVSEGQTRRFTKTQQIITIIELFCSPPDWLCTETTPLQWPALVSPWFWPAAPATLASLILTPCS